MPFPIGSILRRAVVIDVEDAVIVGSHPKEETPHTPGAPTCRRPQVMGFHVPLHPASTLKISPRRQHCKHHEFLFVPEKPVRRFRGFAEGLSFPIANLNLLCNEPDGLKLITHAYVWEKARIP